MKKTVVLGIVSVLVCAAISWATTIRPMSVEDMTRSADVIVDGTSGDVWTAWNPQHTIIYTYTRFRVAKTMKGRPGATVLVKQMGGEKDGLKQILFGVRQFVPGERAVLFLRPSVDNDGTMVVVGLMQGNFRVSHSAAGETVVSNGVSGVAAMNSAGKVTAFTGSPMTLRQLESRVQKVVMK